MAVLVILVLGCYPAATWCEQATARRFETLSKQAEAARLAGRPDQAILLYREAVAANPHWLKGWENLGVLLADRGNYAAAREAFRKIVEAQPDNGDGWALLGLSEFHLARYQQAVGHLERARSLRIATPGLARLVQYHSALCMILLEDFDTAHGLLRLLYRNGVESNELIEALGLAALRIAALPGQEPEAARPLVMSLGRLVLRSFHQPVAQIRTEFESLIARHPDRPGLRYAYGNYLAGKALYEEACEAFRQELQNSPQHALARLQIAAIKLRTNQTEEAQPWAEEAVKLVPLSFAGHLVLGRILLKRGETDRAITELETAAKLAPQSIHVHYSLLTAYQKAGRQIEATREQSALKRLQEYEARLKVQTADAYPDQSHDVEPSVDTHRVPR